MTIFDSEKKELLSSSMDSSLSRILKLSLPIILLVLTSYLAIALFESLILRVLVPISTLILYILSWLVYEFNSHKTKMSPASFEERIKLLKSHYENEIRLREDQLKKENELHRERQRMLENYMMRQEDSLRIQLKELKYEKEQLLRKQVPSIPQLPLDLKPGTMGIYLEYKSLPVHDLIQLMKSLENIYFSLYSIKIKMFERSDNATNINMDSLLVKLEQFYKLHPEDQLVISSINTGSSIIIRFKTGWIPNIGLEENNPVIYFPQGAATLVFATVFLSYSFDFGLTSYDKILSLQKTQNEIAIQEIQIEKLNLEIQDLHNKMKNAPDSLKEDLNLELQKLHSVTLQNENIRQIRIELDAKTEILRDSLLLKQKPQNK